MEAQQTDSALQSLNFHVKAAYERDEPAALQINGRPDVHILSIAPTSFERYGVLRNRGPRLVGQYALKSLLQSIDDGPNQSSRAVLAVVEVNEDMYGFLVEDPEQLEKVAHKVGAPAMRFWAAEPPHRSNNEYLNA